MFTVLEIPPLAIPQITHVMHHNQVRPASNLGQNCSENALGHVKSVGVPEDQDPARRSKSRVKVEFKDILPKRRERRKPVSGKVGLKTWYRVLRKVIVDVETQYSSWSKPQPVSRFGEEAGRIPCTTPQLEDQVRSELQRGGSQLNELEK
jgi:hypothetical protein